MQEITQHREEVSGGDRHILRRRRTVLRNLHTPLRRKADLVQEVRADRPVERETDMATSLRVISAGAFVAAMACAGCYTQLMTPQQYEQSQNVHPVIRPDMSSTIHYSSNCISCHSRQELNDRYYDMQAYGITTAHGFVLDPEMWAASNNPVYDPTYYPDGPGPGISPWWLPPPVIVTTPVKTNTPTQNGTSIRTEGPTRDTPTDRSGVANPAPTTASPSQPVGGTTTSTSTSPPPAPATTGTTHTAPPPSNTNTERARSSDNTNTNTTRTRSDGATRDDGNRHR